MTTPSNRFGDLPPHLPGEPFTTLPEAANVRIERIVCYGPTAPDGFRYDQNRHECVVVPEGAAGRRLKGDAVEMRPGDAMNVPAHKRHRVGRATPDEPTVRPATFPRR
jgi:cupin 2 domain-containing protein